MILRYVVNDGSQTPAVAESVEVADNGTITGWRSVSGTGVGWFAGELPAEEVQAIRALVDAVADASVPTIPPSAPGSATETLELESTGPIATAGLLDGPGPWPSVASAARRLLERLTDYPRSAVTVVLVEPLTARLVHLGREPLHLDLSTTQVRATVWRGYYELADDWSGIVTGPEEVEAALGWTLDVKLDFEAEAGSDVTIHIYVDFAIISGHTRVPVRATFIPAIPQP